MAVAISKCLLCGWEGQPDQQRVMQSRASTWTMGFGLNSEHALSDRSVPACRPNGRATLYGRKETKHASYTVTVKREWGWLLLTIQPPTTRNKMVSRLLMGNESTSQRPRSHRWCALADFLRQLQSSIATCSQVNLLGFFPTIRSSSWSLAASSIFS